jgi:prophage DNA circulation protein
MSTEASDEGGWRSPLRRARAISLAGRLGAVSLVVAMMVVASPAVAGAQARRAPRPSPTPDRMLEQVTALDSELRATRAELGAVRAEIAALAGRIDALATTAAAIKGIAEPMREEVRGLYVESSNVRAEVARLEETYTANTDALAKSRYVLTLLLVATAVLQLVVLAVLLRSR